MKIKFPKFRLKGLKSILDVQSIRVQLTLALMTFTLIPLLVVSFLGYTKASEVLMEQLGETRITQAQILSDQVSLFVKETEKAVATIANLDDISNFKDPQAQSRVLKELKKQYDSLEVLYIIDKSGKVLNMEPITNIGFSTNYAKDSWFDGVVTTGKPYLSDSAISDTTQKPMVFVAYPIYREGQIVGTIRGHISLAKVWEVVNKIKVGETGYAYAIDHEKIIIAHPDEEKVVKQDKSVNTWADKAIKGETGFAEYDYHGTMKISAYSPTEQGWGVFITQDRVEVMSGLVGLSNQIIMVVVIAIILTLITGMWFSRLFTKPINALIVQAEQSSTGDLRNNIAVNAQGDMGRLAKAFAWMIDSLRETLQKVEGNTLQVTAASQQLKAGTEQTAAAVNDTASTVSDMSYALQTVAQRSQGLLSLSESTAQKAEAGGKELNKVTEKMTNIVSTNENNVTMVKRLGEKAQSIEQIVKMITYIADQTNLLALNAAIEAARAGTHGLGFAVVADEVRNLAEKSASAAKEINEMIKEVTDQAEESIISMVDGANEIDSGLEVVKGAELAFKEIVEDILRVKNEINEVSAATQQIHVGIESVSASAQEQSAIVEEVNASSIELSKLAENLEVMIRAFKM